MRRIKFAFTIILLLAFRVNSYSQQEPQLSHYMYNYILFNPAVAGTKPYYIFRADARNQWVGLEGHPTTETISLHAPLFNNKVGVGGYFFNDNIGPLTKNGLTLSYSYHIKLAEKSLLSLGMSGSYFTS